VEKFREEFFSTNRTFCALAKMSDIISHPFSRSVITRHKNFSCNQRAISKW